MAKPSEAKTHVWRFTEENEWEGEGWNGDGQDPLYKLNLFN